MIIFIIFFVRQPPLPSSFLYVAQYQTFFSCIFVALLSISSKYGANEFTIGMDYSVESNAFSNYCHDAVGKAR
ncbi:hypothetical protein CPC08DRAFT_128636 [Agrocybe pediades]|nr:hypothetical protein CPC08DRAFT_128636 [Agrocybe pediades]